jgi:hypothetical protein
MIAREAHEERATFGESAGRLAGLAGALLGWRPDEFWRATPAELACVVRAMGGGEGEQAAGYADLARLKEMFPDEPPHEVVLHGDPKGRKDG